MRRRRGGAQRRGTTVLRHGLTLKTFEGEAVCASVDVNAKVAGAGGRRYVFVSSSKLRGSAQKDRSKGYD